MTKDFAGMLATRILYQLESNGLIKTTGTTVAENQDAIKKARDIAAEMIMNAYRP